MNRVELLAPAGNFACLKAAVNNGADAVYLGGKNFSARAFANNFDNEELIEAIKYAHLRNVKIYVTLNTLLNEDEFNNAIKMADFYYRNNVDALLVQDLGLFYYLKNKYPDFDLHCSTQMHIHNIEGIRNAKKLGFSRVVLARESNLELIKEACKEDIEIETFVHGAICVSYSGQCLMSSYSKNRSANKGMCAQCCRLKYDLLDSSFNKIKTDTDYLLSPKDMFLIEDIPDLIDAGVSCFKIEGRMKSSAYVAYVTRMYRKAIDAYYNKEKFKLSDIDINNFKVLFNRNFTNGLLRNNNDLFGQKTPNHLGIEIGEVINNHNGYTFIKLNKQLNQFDGIRINDFGCIVNMMYKDDLLVNKGNINDIVSIKTDKSLKGKVYKTLDYLFQEELNNIEDKKVPLDLNIYIHENENIKVELRHNDISYTYISDEIGQIAKNAPLSKDNIINQFSKIKDTCYYINDINIDIGNVFLPLKILNEIRREAINQFDGYRLNSFKRTIKENAVLYKEIKDEFHGDNIIKKDNYLLVNDNKYSINDVINTKSEYIDSDNSVICEFGGILKEYKSKIAYYTLNCYNSYAYEFLKKLGFDYIILSSELNDRDIDMLINSYKDRLNLSIKPYVFSKGRRVLMYIKANPFEKYIDSNKKYYLDDGKNKYPIIQKDAYIGLLEPEIRDFIPLNTDCCLYIEND